MISRDYALSCCPGIILSSLPIPPPQLSGHRYIPPHPVFVWVLRIKLRPSCLCSKRLQPLSHLPIPLHRGVGRGTRGAPNAMGVLDSRIAGLHQTLTFLISITEAAKLKLAAVSTSRRGFGCAVALQRMRGEKINFHCPWSLIYYCWKKEILYLLVILGKDWLTVSCERREEGSRVCPNFGVLITLVTIQRTLAHPQFLQPSFVFD